MADLSYLDAPDWQAYRQRVLTAAANPPEKIPATDPRSSVPEALRPGRHRVHPSFFWYNALLVTVVLCVSMGVSLIGAITELLSDGGLPLPFALMIVLAVGLVVLLCAICFLSTYLSWRFMSYELTPEEISVHSGVISKKHFHIPYQRVQAVNQEMKLVQRLIGVCNVKIDNAGGSSNDAMRLNYLRITDAEALRAELYRRKKVLSDGGSIDQFGNAVVRGVMVPSAWMVANCNNDPDTALRVLGVDPAQNAALANSLTVRPSGEASLAAGSAGPAGIAAAVDATAAFGAAPFAVAKESDGTVKGNVLDIAEGMVHDVRGLFGGEEIQTGRVTYEARLSNKELLFSALSGSVEQMGLMFLGVLAALAGIGSFLGSSFEDYMDSMIAQGVGAVVDSAVSQGIGHVVLFGVGVSAVVILLMWVLSTIGVTLKYGGFVVRRREGRIEIEHGILKREFKGVGVDRVQGVVIKQSLVRKLLGYCELSVSKIESVDASGGNEGSAQPVSPTTVIHPFARMKDVPDLLAGLIPEYAASLETPIRPAPVALRRAILRRSVLQSGNFWTLVCVVAVHLVLLWVAGLPGLDAEDQMILMYAFNVFPALYPIFGLVFLGNVVGSVLWYRNSSMGYDRNFLKVINGGFSTTTDLLPRRKIQFAQTKQNPLQRMAKVSRVQAITAGGFQKTKVELWDVAEQDAWEYMQWVLPRQ